jgi:hypothetical protein
VSWRGSKREEWRGSSKRDDDCRRCDDDLSYAEVQRRRVIRSWGGK